MPPAISPTDKRGLAAQLLAEEMLRLGRGEVSYHLCFSDAEWRQAMADVGCPAHIVRMASPTARRSVRGKLGMATICHLRHGHAAVVYVRVQGREWPEIAHTVRHEALHLARPSYGHRKIEAALHGTRPATR